MNKVVLVVPLILLGCASVERRTGPDGAPAYLVKCGNAMKAKCTEKADELCPNGYTELDRKADRYDEMTKIGNVGKLEIKADTTTAMLIQCK